MNDRETWREWVRDIHDDDDDDDCYTSYGTLTNFYDFRFKWEAKVGIGIHPTKAWVSHSKIQSDTLEERYAIKFDLKLGKNATEMYGMLHTTFGASCMNRASIFEWYKRFKEGRESVMDDERGERSKEVNIPGLVGQRVRVRVSMFKF